MRRSRLLALLLTSAACEAFYGCGSEPETSLDIGRRLEKDTGVAWATRTDEASHEVRFLAPEKPVRIGEGAPEQMARAFFDRYREYLHGTGRDDELHAKAPEVEVDGTTHVRFEHYLPGTNIPVFDAASTVHFTKEGALYYAQPGFRADLANVRTAPHVTEDEAARVAAERALSECGPSANGARKVSVELGVHAPEGATSTLAWRVALALDSERCVAPEALVDAESGEIIEIDDGSRSLWDHAGGARFHHMSEPTDIKTIDVTAIPHDAPTIYLLQTAGAAPRVISKRYGWLVNEAILTDTLGTWEAASPARGAAVDAHFNAMHALRYFKEVFGRNGPTGIGTDLDVIVHDPFDKGQNAYHSTAMYIRNEMHCGDGDVVTGGNKLPVCTAFDVVAHEIAHGVTHYTSALVYENEPGALDESFSDVMGASAEHWFETQDTKRNFLVGERLYRDGAGKRDMSDPARFGQPDEYKGRKLCAAGEKPNHNVNDDCHVHLNSGIPNRAFSLMTVGGKHKTSKVAVANGMGWEKSSSLWYRTFTQLHPRSTFRDAALAQITEASRNEPEHLQTVACAWHAVGVLDAFDAGVHPALRNMVCPEKATTCEGVADGYVCNSQAEFAAMRCKDGKFVHALLCDMSKENARCKRASESDWTATLDAEGKLVCD